MLTLKHFRSVLWAALLCLCAWTPVFASEDVVLQVTPQSAPVIIGGKRVPLLGVGDFRYLGMRLYTAWFYADPSSVTAGAVSVEAPKKLVIRYHRDIQKKHIIKAAERNLKNTSMTIFKTIESRVDRLNKHYDDIKKDDEYSLVYEKGSTALLKNGRKLVEVPGEDFAQAYFGIWISEEAINPKLRRKLLGER